MADAILDIKFDNLESSVKEHTGRLEEIDGRLDNHSSEIQRISRWAIDGNGDSAETRIKKNCVEIGDLKEQISRVASDENIQKIASAAVKGVINNARDRDRTVVSKVKAFAPYFAAGCMLVANVVIAILK